jgi:hypothetical protein
LRVLVAGVAERTGPALGVAAVGKRLATVSHLIVTARRLAAGIDAGTAATSAADGAVAVGSDVAASSGRARGAAAPAVHRRLVLVSHLVVAAGRRARAPAADTGDAVRIGCARVAYRTARATAAAVAPDLVAVLRAVLTGHGGTARARLGAEQPLSAVGILAAGLPLSAARGAGAAAILSALALVDDAVHAARRLTAPGLAAL